MVDAATDLTQTAPATDHNEAVVESAAPVVDTVTGPAVDTVTETAGRSVVEPTVDVFTPTAETAAGVAGDSPPMLAQPVAETVTPDVRTVLDASTPILDTFPYPPNPLSRPSCPGSRSSLIPSSPWSRPSPSPSWT